MAHGVPTSPPYKHGAIGTFCTYCVHSPVPAVRSCLLCEASLCTNHLRVHSKSPGHILIHPACSLKNKDRPAQQKILECRGTEDFACTCGDCLMAAIHEGPKATPLLSKWQVILSNTWRQLSSEREEAEGRLQTLQEGLRDLEEEAAHVTERVADLCRDIRRQLVDLERRAMAELSRQVDRISLSISDLIRQQEVKKDELSRKIHHLEDLCHMTNPIPNSMESNREDVCKQKDGDEEVKTSGDLDHDLGALDETRISEILHTGVSAIAKILTRGIATAKVTDISLDRNTAANNIYLTTCLKTVSTTRLPENRPETAERFRCNQVFSSQSFSTGRHCWDVECHSWGEWKLGVCYPTMDREGDQAYIGNNDKSWCLWGYFTNMFTLHDGRYIYLPIKLSHHIIRVYLDYEAGQVSFYELGDPIRHLHTFTANFAEPLRAAFYVCSRSWVVIRSDKW